MNKKYLSALLFGALTLASTGTFTSCKDYDDDIENLQGQINSNKDAIKANADAIASLRQLVESGVYVKSVTKTETGILVTMSNGKTEEIKNLINEEVEIPEVKPGSVVTVNATTGEIEIDGTGTGFFAAKSQIGEVKVPYINAEGELITFDEEGNEVHTGIKKNEVVAVANPDGSYSLSVPGADGKMISIKLPSPASAITAMDVKQIPGTDTDLSGNIPVELVKYNFAPSDAVRSAWKGTKTLPAKDTKFVLGNPDPTKNSGFVVTVTPAHLDLSDVAFTLVNSKGVIAKNLTFSAAQGDLNVETGGSRVASTQGEYVLFANTLQLSDDDYKKFDKQFENTTGTAAVKFALNAGGAFSNPERNIIVKNIVAGPAIDPFTTVLIDVETMTVVRDNELQTNKTYMFYNVEETCYDMWYEVSDADTKLFGLVKGELPNSFKITSNPEKISGNPFQATIHYMDVTGKVTEITKPYSISSQITSELVYDLVEYPVQADGQKNFISVDLAKMKTALGSGLSVWEKEIRENKSWNVEVYKKYKDGKLSDQISGYTSEIFGKGTILVAEAKEEDQVNDFAHPNFVKIGLKNTTVSTKLSEIGKTYYVKVNFFNKATSQEMNHIIVPVKFTAPEVSSIIKAKQGLMADGLIKAYYTGAAKTFALTNFFEEVKDEYGTVTVDALPTDNDFDGKGHPTTDFFTLNGTTFVEATTLELAGSVVEETGVRPGYGKEVTLKLHVPSVHGWNLAATDALKKAYTYSFKMSILSPIFEGNVTVKGLDIKSADLGTAKARVTAENVAATMYDGTPFYIVPDKNDGSWTSLTSVAKDVDATYLTADWVEAVEEDLTADPKVEFKAGYLQLSKGSTTVTGTAETKVKLTITDKWDCVKVIEVPVKISGK